MRQCADPSHAKSAVGTSCAWGHLSNRLTTQDGRFPDCRCRAMCASANPEDRRYVGDVISADPLLNVGLIVPRTEAEGPGVRFALWVQGCPLRCPGCCNPEMLEDKPATSLRASDVVAQIEKAE